jgi:hypothetical protein
MLNFGRLIITFVIIIAACLVAPRADAQSPLDTRRTFVDVSGGPDWDDTYSDSTRVPGATWRSGLAIGFDFGRSGVELDVSVPQWHVKNFAPRRFQYAGPTFGWEQQGHFYEASESARRRSLDVAVLYRRNLPINRHVTFSWLAGGASVDRQERFTTVTNEVLPGGQLIEANTMRSTSSRHYLAAVGRADVELRIGAHLSVVPRLRVTVFPSLLDDSGAAPRVLVARPEVAVRWGF